MAYPGVDYYRLDRRLDDAERGVRDTVRRFVDDRFLPLVREHFGDKVVRAVVPRSVRLSEAPSFGQPIITFDPRSRGAVAYRDVAKEVHHGSA